MVKHPCSGYIMYIYSKNLLVYYAPFNRIARYIYLFIINVTLQVTAI